MRFRERLNDDQHEQELWAPGSGQPGDGGLSQARRAGQDFLRAGEHATNRALSANSEAFLEANRQEGGE